MWDPSVPLSPAMKKYSNERGLLWAVVLLSIVVFKISTLFCPEMKRTNAEYYMLPFLKLHESLEMIKTRQHRYSLCQLSRLSYGIIRGCSLKYAFHFHSLVMTMHSFREDLFSLHLRFYQAKHLFWTHANERCIFDARECVCVCVIKTYILTF